MLMSCQRTKNDINIKLIPTPRNMVLNAGTSYTMDCSRIGPLLNKFRIVGWSIVAEDRADGRAYPDTDEYENHDQDGLER